MKINILTIVLIIFTASSEHMVSLFSFNIRINQLFALFFVIYNFNKYVLKNFQFNSKIILSYILIIFFIILNDLIIGVKLLNIFNSIFFFLMSLTLYFFFFNIFLKDENNLSKFFIFMFISLIIYKSGNFLFFHRETLASKEAIFGSRFAAPFLYLTLSISYYLILKKKNNFFLLFNFLFLSLIIYYWSFSHMFVMTTTLILYCTLFIFNIRISYLFFASIMFFLIFFIDLLFLRVFFNELLAFLFAKRADAFVFIPNILENFPIGSGSKSIINNYYESFLEVKKYFNYEDNKISSLVSNENYTTTHSMVMHMLLKNGFFSIIPFLYLFYIMIKNIFKILDHEKINKGIKFFSVYIFCFFFYALFFNGIGTILIEFPIYFGFIMSIKKNYQIYS